MKTIRLFYITLSILFLVSSLNLPVYAGPYTDDLSRCIIESTTSSDRVEFVKWMFSAMSKHPAVKSLSSVSENQIKDANAKVAEFFMKLLTESCRKKAEKAIKYEGPIALQTSFQILGQVAANELFSNPEVAAVMSDLNKYIDIEKLKASLDAKDNE